MKWTKTKAAKRAAEISTQIDALMLKINAMTDEQLFGEEGAKAFALQDRLTAQYCTARFHETKRSELARIYKYSIR